MNMIRWILDSGFFFEAPELVLDFCLAGSFFFSDFVICLGGKLFLFYKVMELQDLLDVQVTRKVTSCVQQKENRQKTINGCRIFKLLDPPETSDTSSQV